MNTEMAVIDFVADVPRSAQYCAFNVIRIRGNHRHCDHYARERVGGYDFCKRHAKVVREAAANSVPKDSVADEREKEDD